MINEEAVEAYNTRLTFDYSNIDRLTPAQRDVIKSYGSQAENLLKNRDLGQFVHHFKFQLSDRLADITTHTPEANAERIAIGNELSGVNGLITSLKRAVYYRNKILSWEQQPVNSVQKSELKQVFDPNR